MATATRIETATTTRSTRNLYLLLQGQFATHMGNQLYDLAMLLWIKQVTGSASLMGLALLLTHLPSALLGPLGGKLADRFGSVRTMVVADLVSGLTVGLVALCIWWRAEPLVMVLALGAGNLVLGVAASCFDPAVLALIPVLTPGPRLAKGNAAHQSSRMGGQVLGQGLAGVLFSVVGTAGAFFLNALSFFISAVTSAGIRVPGREEGRRPTSADGKGTARRAPKMASLPKETLAMLRGVLRQPDLRALLLYVAAFHLCLSCLPVLLPFYAEHALGLSDWWFGFFVAAYTIGIMAGFAVAGSLPPPASRFRLVARVGLAVGALFGATALARSFLLAWPLLLGIGVGIGIIVVNLMTELQLRSPEGERGGIMGAVQAVGGTSFPLGMALTGILLDAMARQGLSYAVSTRMVLGISAAGCVVVALAAIRASRSADDHGRQAG